MSLSYVSVHSGITDAHNHALVGDGKHGRAERIQTFRCQACHTTFSARRDTPLYRLKTPSQQIAMVLSALAERLDPSAAERVFGYRQATITKCSGKRRPAWTASLQKTDPKWIGKGLVDLSTISHRSTDVQVMRRQK